MSPRKRLDAAPAIFHWVRAAGLLIILTLSLSAADPRQYAVEISVDVVTGPLGLRLHWTGSDIARQYFVRRRTLGESGWGSPRATLPGDSTEYIDYGVTDGTAYEYEVQMESVLRAGGGWMNAYGYVYAGANVPAADQKGKVILVVDSAVAGALSSDLAGYQRNLVGAGWTVVRRDVSRATSPSLIRSQIKAEHDADPFNVRAVVLLGHVPVPYSGNIAPDLHESHRGAWPADLFYGDLDGSWTDTSVNVVSQDSEDNNNRPGDGKFDQSQIPSPVDLEVGRIDFWNLPSFGARTEVELLRGYLRKNHNFRHRQFTAARRGLIRDNFGDLDGDAPAVDAWRHFPQFFGPGNIREVGPGGFFSTLNSESFLWAYGCGGGGYNKADGVGSTWDFAQNDPKAVFLVLHGSYFGDWNNTDNFLRAAIASPNYTLASIWSGLPHWYMHPMGLGATIGHATRISQNNISDYKSQENFSPAQVHVSLIGDPTLEMFPVVPPSNLSAVPGGTVNLSWGASSDENVVGYHVYYSTSANGPFQRLTPTPVSSTSYSHAIGAGTYHYMVRALKHERTGSGTFFNLSQGIFATVTQGDNGGPPPTVAINGLDTDASEASQNRGEFQITRSSVSPNALTVELLIGGTAQNGVDYEAIPSTVTIPAGSAEVRVVITPLIDGLNEGDETITMQVRPNAAYTVGSPSVGFLRIVDQVANQAPVISAVADQNILVNGRVTVPFQVNDPETQPALLNVRALSSNTQLVPAGGLIVGGSGANRTIELVPVSGASGVSTITLLASDGNIESSISFTLTVTRPNLRPIATGTNYVTNINRSVAITLLGSDPEGAPLTYVIKTNPVQGTLAGTPPNLTYTPNTGVTGNDQFVFSVSDGVLESTPATVTIQIVNSNRPPVATPQTIVTTEDVAVPITLSGTDADGDALTYEIVTGTTMGVLSGQGRNYYFTPVANASGHDAFMFRVRDGALVSETATISITITPVNDAPSGASTNLVLNEDTPLNVRLIGNDVDGDALTFQIVSGPTKGQLTGTPPELTFIPSANVSGTDSFTYKVRDAASESALATVSLQIVAVNDPPTALDQTVLTAEDEVAAVSVGGSDSDGDALTYRVVTPPAKGTLSGTPPNLFYTPLTNENGADSFTYVLNDGLVDSAPATVSIVVEPRNDPPSITSIPSQFSRKNGEMTMLTFTVGDVDRPIAELLVRATSSHTNVVQPENISITGAGTNRSLAVLPERGATGTTIITIFVEDGTARAETSFLLTVTNTPPIAVGDEIVTLAGTTTIHAAQLLENDDDPDGDTLRIVSVTGTQGGGTVSLANNEITYVGEASAAGDTFQYVIEDSSGARATATVAVAFVAQPKIESIQVRAGGVATLMIKGLPGAAFVVQSSVDAKTWTTIHEGTSGADGRGEFTDGSGTGTHHRLYRVEWP